MYKGAIALRRSGVQIPSAPPEILLPSEPENTKCPILCQVSLAAVSFQA
jgi:hypothetical protein